MYARITAVHQIAVTRCLIAVTGRLITVGRGLIAICRRLIAVGSRLVAVGGRLVSIGESLFPVSARPTVFIRSGNRADALLPLDRPVRGTIA